MENKAQRKVLIIIGIILIIIAILAYVLSLFIDNENNETGNNGTNNTPPTTSNVDEVTTDFTLLENESVFFGLSDIINHYLDSIMVRDTDELMTMLDEEYINEIVM